MLQAIGVCKGGDNPIYAVYRDMTYDILWVYRDKDPILGPYYYPEDWGMCSNFVSCLAMGPDWDGQLSKKS